MHVGRTEAKAEPPGAWEPVTGGGMAGAQAGRAAAVGEPGTGKRGPRQLWPGRGRPWGCHHSTDCKAVRPSPQPSAQEAALEPCVLAICPSARPSIHNYLPFAILVARFVQSLGSPEKKIQPPRNSDSRISAPLSPGTWGFGMAQPASQLTRSRDPLSERFCPLGSPPCFPSGPAMES